MENQYEYEINLINQIIWKSRYLGLMKKYDKATKTVNEALAKLDSKTFKSRKPL